MERLYLGRGTKGHLGPWRFSVSCSGGGYMGVDVGKDPSRCTLKSCGF